MIRYHGGPSETILATTDAIQVSVSHSRSLLPGKLQREGRVTQVSQDWEDNDGDFEACDGNDE